MSLANRVDDRVGLVRSALGTICQRMGLEDGTEEIPDLILRHNGDPRSSMCHNVWRVIDHALAAFEKERMQMEKEEQQAEEMVEVPRPEIRPTEEVDALIKKVEEFCLNVSGLEGLVDNPVGTISFEPEDVKFEGGQ